MYQVIEHAGQDRETVVAEFDTLQAAHRHTLLTYDNSEVDDLGVDILKDGSTEF